MFPYRDDNPSLLTPYVTIAIIVINVLVWIGVQGMGAELDLARSICQLGLIPGDLLGKLPAGTTIPVGSGMSCVISAGIPWQTPITSMFLHGGWLHIAGNMWFLWIFGNNVEDSMGHGRYAAFYILSGLAAAAAQVFLSPGSAVPMVGASGAISGVMGAYGILYPRVRIHTLIILIVLFFRVTVPAWVMLGYWFFLQLLGSTAGEGAGVAFWAHVGGFSAGMLLIMVFRDPVLLAKRQQLIAARAWSTPGGSPLQ